MGALLSLAASVAGIFENLASWLRSRADQNTGRKLQQADDLAETVKANTDAQTNADRNRALSRSQIIDSLHADGAGH